MSFDFLLQSIKEKLNAMDDMRAKYYYALLEKHTFIELMKSVFLDRRIENKQTAYEAAIRQGYRVVDIVELVNLLDGHEFEFSFVPEIEMKGEESVNPPSQHETIEEEKGAYFSLIYNTEELVGDEPTQTVILSSNIISEVTFRETIAKFYANSFFEENRNKFTFLENISLSAVDSAAIERDKIECNTEETMIVLEGTAETLETVYNHLRRYFFPLHGVVKVENIFKEIRKQICSFADKTKEIKISKLLHLDSDCNKEEYVIGDFLLYTPKEWREGDAVALLNCLKRFEKRLPDVVLKELFEFMEPREIAVIQRRYFEGDLNTLEEVGRHYNVSRERIRQVETKVADKIQHISQKEKWLAFISLLKTYCRFNTFITIEDFENLGLSKGTGILLDKIVGELAWDNSLDLGYFNKNVERKFLQELEELPSEFTFADLEDYAAYISLSMNGVMSVEEIKFLILRKYHVHGDFIVKGRMTLRVVLSYLMGLYFPEGFDLYEDENMEFLRAKAQEHFDGFELAENNRAIRARLQDFCVPVGRGRWKWDTEEQILPVDLRNEIVHYVESYPSPILPISVIMVKYYTELVAIEVSNKYHLQGILKKIFKDKYAVNRDYILKEQGNTLYDLIEAFIKQSPTIVTKNDILKNFPGVSDIAIQQAVANTKVINMNGYYVHLDNLQITEEELAVFKESVDLIMSQPIIYHAKPLFNAIKRTNSGLFSRIGIAHYLQFFYLLRELFPSGYEYNRPYLAPLGVKIISGEAQVIEKILQFNEVSIAEIRGFAKEVGTIIDRYIEFVDANNDLFVFKNHNNIITVESAGVLDEEFEQLDEVLDDFMGDEDYKVLALFYNYWRLPELKCPWDEWLLYSIIGKYSQRYKVAVSSNYIAEAIPLVLRADFDDSELNYDQFANWDANVVEEYQDIEDALDYEDILGEEEFV